MASKFNKSFVNVGWNLAAKEPPSDKNFESYPPNVSTIFSGKSLSAEEFTRALFSLEMNKTQGLNIGIFPDKSKIARVSQ